MPERIPSRRTVIPVVGLLTVLLSSSCMQDGFDGPMYAERLVGLRLIDLDSRTLTWTFDETTVTIENDGEPIPADLLPDIQMGDSSLRIVARWEYALNELELSQITIDGVSVDSQTTTLIKSAGPIQIIIGSRQYGPIRE